MDDKSLLNFALCDVLSVEDQNEAGRIKVRIPGIDKETDEELPYCFPALPKLLHVFPKKGEKVIVFFQSPTTKQSWRIYIGPVIIQDYGLSYTPGSNTSGKTTMSQQSLTAQDITNAGEAPSMNGNNTGTVPKQTDIAIRGRSNADIIFKDNEAKIRCGFLKNPHDTSYETKLNYNENDPAYIQLKYDHGTDNKNAGYDSNINVVADRINLLSYDSTDTIDNLGNPDLAGNEEFQKIFEKAHVLPYGDLLVDFLNDFVRVFLKHTHPFHQKPPCLNEADHKAVTKDLNEVLSTTVRIN